MRRKVALVTGAGKGIGKSIAITLAQAGYDVAINYNTSKTQAEDSAESVVKCGGRTVVLQANVQLLNDIQRMFAQFLEHFDHIDLLVNNSGITKMAPFLETTPEMFNEVMNTDLKGLFFCSQAAANIMVNKGTAGVIVNISSNHAVGCWPNSTVYAAAKAGVNKLTMNMALELSEFGIRVVGIAPGYTQLEWSKGEAYMKNMVETSKKIPAARFASTTEIAEAVVYLASEKASYITGTTLFIDGGALLPVVASNRF